MVKTSSTFEQEIVLSTDLITLRPVEAADASLIRPIALDPRVWTHTVTKIATEDDILAHVRAAVDERISRIRYSFAIQRADGTVMGLTSFGNYSALDRRVEIGWTWLGIPFHGTGVNPVVKWLMLRYAFDVLELERVEFKTDALNSRSRAALKKIGAREEGILRSHTLMHDGRRRDTVYYSILKAEWPTAFASNINGG